MQVVKRSTRFPELWDDGDIFDRVFRRMNPFVQLPELSAETLGWTPSVDLVDNDEEYLLTADLPGVRREDVEITFEDGVLTLKGMRKQESEKKERKYHIWERSYGSFERSFTLPRTVDPEKIRADFEDGVVKIHMPKSAESRGRRIQIAAK